MRISKRQTDHTGSGILTRSLLPPCLTACLLGGLIFSSACRADDAADQPAADDSSSSSTPTKTVDELIAQATAASAAAQTDEDYSALIEVCRQVLAGPAGAPQQKFAQDMLGWAFNRRGQLRAEAQPAEALADFEESLRNQPGYLRALYNRAISYAQAGRLDEALADLNLVVQAQPGYFKGVFNRAEVKIARGDVAGSLPDYHLALRLEPDNAAAYNARGFARFRLGEFQAALNDFNQSIRLDPRNVNAYVNLGDTLAEMGRYGLATQEYRKAIDIDAKSPRAYISWSWLMATCPLPQYRNDTALSYARYAVKQLGTDDYHYLDVLAAALANAGQFDEARKVQEQAIGLAPEPARALLQKRLDLYAGSAPFRSPTPLTRAPTPTPAFVPTEGSGTAQANP